MAKCERPYCTYFVYINKNCFKIIFKPNIFQQKSVYVCECAAENPQRELVKKSSLNDMAAVIFEPKTRSFYKPNKIVFIV